MNRRDAVQLLHERHPGLIQEPGDVDLEALHLEILWCHPEIEWAKGLMPPLLMEAFRRTELVAEAQQAQWARRS